MRRLGHIIELMQGARSRYSMLELTIDVWVDDDLLRTTCAVERDEESWEALGIREEQVRLWVGAPTRWRVRLPTTEQGRDGETWWSTEPDGSFTTGVAGRWNVESPEGEVQPFEELWDPALLIGELWLEPRGRTAKLGRTATLVSGSPRAAARPSGNDFIILGFPGGDAHELAVDEELGIVLQLRSFWQGQEMLHEEIAAIEVDGSVPEGFFGRREV
jgi:hypothetical protein